MTAYHTTTKRVSETGSGYRDIKIDGDDYQALIEAGETFRFLRTYEIKPEDTKYGYLPYWVKDGKITIALTCRREKRRNTFYYFAHWRQTNYHKKLKKAYLGKAPTLAKLIEVCDRFFDELEI